MSFYAVAKGREIGIFSTWLECKSQVDGFKNAVYKKFKTHKDATNFIHLSNASIPYQQDVKERKNSLTEFSVVTPNKPSINSSPSSPTVVYTDGSCLGNGRGQARAGVGIYFGPEDTRNVSHAVPRTEPQTNQRAELMAAVEALEIISDTATKSFSNVELRTDSKWVINGVKLGWIPNWKRNGWITSSKTPVLHQDLWIRMDAILSRLEVNFVHVKGHSGEIGNEAVDLLARKGALMD